jgi:ethanolamine utilization protein EutA (predicted chaperonin)
MSFMVKAKLIHGEDIKCLILRKSSQDKLKVEAGDYIQIGKTVIGPVTQTTGDIIPPIGFEED